MRKPFKGVLCSAKRPDTWSGDPCRCKRHAGHSGQHRIVYRDGQMAVWNNGDRDPTILPRVKPAKEKP